MEGFHVWKFNLYLFMTFVVLITSRLFYYKEILDKIQGIQPAIGHEIRIALAQFVAYFRCFCIEVVGPERFCVFHAARRTNNDLGSWHRIVTLIMGGAN